MSMRVGKASAAGEFAVAMRELQRRPTALLATAADEGQAPQVTPMVLAQIGQSSTRSATALGIDG